MAVLDLKDIVRCPTCGGSEIVYTCEPKCCFNHLCADCRTTFQLVTRKTGRVLNGWSITVEEPPSGEPTAACSACESLALAVVDEERKPYVICASCHEVLELLYEDVAAEA